MFCVVDAQPVRAVLHLNTRGRWWPDSVNGNQRDIQQTIRVKTQKKQNLHFGHWFILNLKKKSLKHKQFHNVNNFSQYTRAVKKKKQSPFIHKGKAASRQTPTNPSGLATFKGKAKDVVRLFVGFFWWRTAESFHGASVCMCVCVCWAGSIRRRLQSCYGKLPTVRLAWPKRRVVKKKCSGSNEENPRFNDESCKLM